MEVESGQRTAPVWKCRFFPSEVNEKQLKDWHRTYMIPDEIEFFVPGLNDWADDLPLGCVVLNQVVLAAGLRLLFPSIVRKFFYLEFSRPLAREFNSLYSFKSDGKRSGWWSIRRRNEGYRKAPFEDQPPPAQARPQTEETPKTVQSPARSVEEITSFPTRGELSSSPAFRPPPSSSQILFTYLGSTPDRDEEYLKLHKSIPKPVCDFFRSNSLTQDDIVELLSSTRRAISVMGKSWTPVQQKYFDGMGTVESIIAASVELAEEKKLRASSEDILLRREEELRKKEDELKALTDDLEAANKSRAKLEHELEVERKAQAELRTTLEKSVDKEEVIAEFKSSDAYLADQEKVYFLTMEELIETTVEKRPDWDVQFLRDEPSELKRKSILNPPSPEEVDQDQTGAEE
ncbi:hypothetical protein Adt_38383 [Abeliophyllum distichum]|uniref:Uncharacterized protein n=1 Tax=Abeliophyllum distichum TaxID=126358 RepID=A0ABD1Q236_9LAMI